MIQKKILPVTGVGRPRHRQQYSAAFTGAKIMMPTKNNPAGIKLFLMMPAGKMLLP